MTHEHSVSPFLKVTRRDVIRRHNYGKLIPANTYHMRVASRHGETPHSILIMMVEEVYICVNAAGIHPNGQEAKGENGADFLVAQIIHPWD